MFIYFILLNQKISLSFLDLLCNYDCEDDLQRLIFDVDMLNGNSLCEIKYTDDLYNSIKFPYSSTFLKSYVNELCKHKYMDYDEVTLDEYAMQAAIFGMLNESTCMVIPDKNIDILQSEKMRSRAYFYFKLICKICLQYYLMPTTEKIKIFSKSHPKLMNNQLEKIINDEIDEYLKYERSVLIFKSFEENMLYIQSEIRGNADYQKARGYGENAVGDGVIYCYIAKKLDYELKKYTSKYKVTWISICIIGVLCISIFSQLVLTFRRYFIKV